MNRNMTYQERGAHRLNGITRKSVDKLKVTSEKKITTQESRGHGITKGNKEKLILLI